MTQCLERVKRKPLIWQQHAWNKMVDGFDDYYEKILLLSDFGIEITSEIEKAIYSSKTILELDVIANRIIKKHLDGI